MLYTDFQDEKISTLVLGCMRLPVIDGDDNRIDEDATAEMIDYAYTHGINYFDTAWGYHGGHSEEVVGKCLTAYPRESFKLASKFPGYDLGNMGKHTEIFEAQLKKCQVEYFDYYLVHNVCEMNINQYLDPKNTLMEFLLEQKSAGRIRHIGFSIHGNQETFLRFLEAYGEHMEFCQVELNYYDWSFQDAKAKVEELNKRNIPIWVMEPLRGGQLAKLSDEDTARLAALRPEESVPAWALRYLQTVPGVAVVLTGASNLQQLQENIATYEELKPLNEEEMATLLSIAEAMIAKTAVPCTACHYCSKYCPLELDIPHLLHLYNEACQGGAGDFIAPMALAALEKGKGPEDCIGCGACQVVCPQSIAIPEELAAFAKKMGR